MTISDQIREYFEERCAILEFECGLPREKAEALALAECETWRNSVDNKNGGGDEKGSS